MNGKDNNFQKREVNFLSHLRVLDLADKKAEFCSMLLAEMGADVTKLEIPGSGIDKQALKELRMRNLAASKRGRKKRGESRLFDVSSIPDRLIAAQGGLDGFVVWMLDQHPKEAIKLVSKIIQAQEIQIDQTITNNDNRIVINVIKYDKESKQPVAVDAQVVNDDETP